MSDQWTVYRRRYKDGMRSANERGRYHVTSPLISWAYTQNDPCVT